MTNIETNPVAIRVQAPAGGCRTILLTFTDDSDSTSDDVKFADYCRAMVQEYDRAGQTACKVLLDNALRRFIRYAGEDLRLSDIDKDCLIGYIDYLNRDKSTRKSGKPLSDIYKESLFTRLMVVLNRAERDALIPRNPGKSIDRRIKPHAKESTRCYLTLDEVREIAATPYDRNNDIKPAFLFGCFSGLRYSDLCRLEWSNIKRSPSGDLQIEMTMKKTGHSITIPLSANALAFLPPRGSSGDDSRVFRHLPFQACNADARLHSLMRHTKISKNVTFHVARHTFATLTLSYGADLYTVSKLLGHSNIRTTQIYAKIVDEQKRRAVNLIPMV